MTQPHVPFPGAQLIHESPESCANTIATWLVHYVANLVQRSPSEIEHQVPLSRYGVDSASAVDMTGAIEAWVGLELDPVLVYEYPTIQGLATHLTQTLIAGLPNGEPK